ncbi:MAG: hypothetical protein JXA00_01440 [Candidatus Thermoplasmatota archaeon]|nr:hypothetical protein [Candidatus Thermoplasmatota archaeon]
MKRNTYFLITALLASFFMIAGSIQAGTISLSPQEPTHIKVLVYEFSDLQLTEHSDYTTIRLSEATGSQTTPGEPVLPVATTVVELPFTSHVTSIEAKIGDTYHVPVSQKVTPAPHPVPCITQQAQHQLVENTDIYTTDAFFPGHWFSYRLTSGLNAQNHLTTFLTLQVNPVRYNPIQRSLSAIKTLQLSITYDQPVQPFTAVSDAYDLVILCYDSYAPVLEPLVDHKNAHGIHTLLVPLQDVTDGTYFPVEGRDVQEQMKYFIRNAKESWNITYVMLVGNFKQVPARYAALETDTGGTYEELAFVSDLYYADLYDAYGNFSSWDTDNDGNYSEWPYPESHPREDIVDLVPDVHVGRLPCMLKAEVRTVVNKIIDYETHTFGADWFNRFVAIGGDTFDKSWEGGTDYNEGEEATAQALAFMPQCTPIKIWTSLNNLTTRTMRQQLNAGAGFVYFCGHGNPFMWSTHANGDYHNWTESFDNFDMRMLSNTEQYSILMCGGCHNSEIDVTPLNFITGLLNEKLQYFSTDPVTYGSFWKYNWVPECWSAVFVNVRGGAIATMGSTGYGGVSIGDYNHNNIPDCVEGLDGWFETQFFRLYSEENLTILGQTYSQLVANYVNQFPVDTDRYDAKIVETHILLGDPSLRIGGYQ